MEDHEGNKRARNREKSKVEVLNIILHISSYPMHTHAIQSLKRVSLSSIDQINEQPTHMHICNAPSIPSHLTEDIPVPNQAAAPTPFQCIMFGILPPKERTHESIVSPTPPAPNKNSSAPFNPKSCIKTYVAEDLSRNFASDFLCACSVLLRVGLFRG